LRASAGSGITWLHRILGGFAFAATFASPFFVLALFPSLLKKMPKSGSWLNSVKVVMGFLELAAALKFLRAGELLSEPKPVFFTYDLVLGLWIAMSLLCGLYLLNFYRLPHDSQLEHIGVLRMLFGLAFIALGFYMLPAQFKLNASGESQRPNGKVYAWIDSFLLPEPLDKGDLAWSGNLKQVLDQARAEAQKTGQRRLVFVDFTGESCTNCKLNEKDVFSKPDIQKLFDKYALVQLYTDKVPDKFYAPELRGRFGGSVSRQKQDAEANLWFQKAAFDTEQLPLYVILEARADGKIEVLGQYDEGKISNDAAFAQFLKGPLENATTATAQLSGR
jgi:thiol:disulfide interchange protein DsbD